jgi:pimeloyl-ACP methyl ester carboxylesterase
MSDIRIQMIHVPGAQLYCKVRGSSPATILLLAGGSGDADSFDLLAEELKQQYTVITYDRRGYARSPLEDPTDTRPIPIERQSADANHILEVLCPNGAYLLGNSAGAIIALDMLLSSQTQLRRVVAHEPPLIQLLSSSEQVDLEPHQNESADVTLNRFAASLGLKRGLNGKPRSPEQTHNSEVFLTREAPAIDQYHLDLAALAQYRDTLVFGAGAEGSTYFPYQCAYKAAQIVQAPFVEFPGKHNGFVAHAAPFAKQLMAIFQG